jgi:hypothetical protein
MTDLDIYTTPQDYRNGQHIRGRQGRTIKISDYERLSTFELLKPHGIYNKQISVNTSKGTRECIVLKHARFLRQPRTEEELGQAVLNASDYRLDGVLFIKSMLDEVYTRQRWVSILVSVGDLSDDKIDYPDDPLWTPSRFHRFYLVKEKWLQWGDKHICYDNGLKTSDFYNQGDSRCVRWKGNDDALEIGKFSSKFVSEFATNPFHDGHAQPRVPTQEWRGEKFFVNEGVKGQNARASIKAYKWKREIMEAVFSPKHVGAMMEKYGQDWMESI